MGKIAKYTRRAFLIGSAAIVGGVAFGVYKYKTPHANPLLDDLAEGEAALTPYVKIDGDTITLITPRSDLGQGAYHVQAVLIAEELDVDLDQVQVDPGPPSPAYYNTALAGEAVPFPPTDRGWVAESLRAVADAPMKFMGLQLTGGSTTVPDGWTKLRVAGAVARETLKEAAAQKSGISRDRLKTERGQVILPDGSTLTYQELAPIAAGIDPIDRVDLRAPSEWRMIGKPMQRMDIVAKSTGMQEYGIDFDIDGMVHAAVRMNPRQGGELNSFDASAAQGMRGVSRIVEIPGGVAAIADNTWRAFKAVQAVECDWGPAPFPAEMEQHWQALDDALKGEEYDSRQRDEGDIAQAEGGIEVEYRAPYLAHAPLEPINATVLVTDDRADVWTGTQIPRFVQNNVAKITGLDAEQVHVHVLMMGGSFGHRLEDEVVKQAAQIAIQMKGTPVKLTYSREEDMVHDFTRPISMARMKGTAKNGHVHALDYHVAAPSLMASQMGERQGLSLPGPDSSIVQGAWEQPYAIPNYRVTGYRAQKLAPISSWRSVGASINGFFHEGVLNELIHEAGQDLVQERLRLMTHEPSRKVVEAVAEMSGWGRDVGPNKGLGIAFSLSFGVACAEVVEVTATEAGIKIDKMWVAAEVGRVVDPVNFDGLVKGGALFGLGHAMFGEITYADGAAEQENFDTYESLRLYQVPEIEVRGLENDDKVHGVGEPPVPPAAAALAEAIFQATGTRLREMPFRNFVDFV